MNYYHTLGLDKNASFDDIKIAYRKLAKIHHPDMGGDVAKFQEIQIAYDTLSNPNKRMQYDNVNKNPNVNDIFSNIFNFGNFNAFRQNIYTITLVVTLEQVANGTKETININTPEGPKLVSIDIPIGIEDGYTMKYADIINDGILHIVFRIKPHKKFQRVGLDLYSEISVDFLKLVAGTTTTFTDIYGFALDVTIPSMTKPGTKMRLSGHGLKSEHTSNTNVTNTYVGDQYVLINGTLPDMISDQLQSMIKQELKDMNK